MTLTETTTNSGVFRNSAAGVATNVGSAVVDSTLDMAAGENLVATYTDVEDNIDTISTLLNSSSAVSLLLSSGEGSPTSADPDNTATFGADVSGFQLSDISVVNGSASNLAGSSGVYTFDVSPASDGLVQVFVAAGAAFFGGDPTASDALSRVSDRMLPRRNDHPHERHDYECTIGPRTISFSETVVGFTESDLMVTNATVSDFTGAASNYSMTITPIAAGAVVVEIPAGSCNDVAGNLVSGTTSNIDYDPANGLGIPESEYNALVALYDGTTGDLWTTNTQLEGIIGDLVAWGHGDGWSRNGGSI